MLIEPFPSWRWRFAAATTPRAGCSLTMTHNTVRALAGLATVVAIVAIVAGAAGMFEGRFTNTVPLTVLSQRAGLVMDPDAKVKLQGVDVGRVDSIEELPNGRAAIHLAIDTDQLHRIPNNSVIDISSATVFGAKTVDFMVPAAASAESLRPGQVLDANQVTVEFNTLFEQLTAVLSKVQPDKLNATLRAISSALDGRGQKFGQTLGDLDELLAHLEPGLPNLTQDLEMGPAVFNSYADAAPDLLQSAENATQLSQTLIDEQDQLDQFLVSTIGLADSGNDVIGTNTAALSKVLHLLVPTSALTNQYNPALTCGLGGLYQMSIIPPQSEAGVVSSSGLQLGRERYRYPSNLPKVAATGGPQCTDLPVVPQGTSPPLVVADVGSNPAGYGNTGPMLNSDALKQFLFGPLDGPPRNTSQIGQPG
jgi:phospholipid/cholesterol/gamma-HCH transport system substrate-binding protein